MNSKISFVSLSNCSFVTNYKPDYNLILSINGEDPVGYNTDNFNDIIY